MCVGLSKNIAVTSSSKTTPVGTSPNAPLGCSGRGGIGLSPCGSDAWRSARGEALPSPRQRVTTHSSGRSAGRAGSCLVAWFHENKTSAIGGHAPSPAARGLISPLVLGRFCARWTRPSSNAWWLHQAQGWLLLSISCCITKWWPRVARELPQ